MEAVVAQFKVLSRNFLERLSKTTENLSHNSRYWGQYLNLDLPNTKQLFHENPSIGFKVISGDRRRHSFMIIERGSTWFFEVNRRRIATKYDYVERNSTNFDTNQK
jgi:hypothetical protein